MRVESLPPQDQLIVVEALLYWAYRTDTDKPFDRSDPRRNRALTLARQLLRNGDIPQDSISELVEDDWSSPVSDA